MVTLKETMVPDPIDLDDDSMEYPIRTHDVFSTDDATQAGHFTSMRNQFNG